MAKHQKKQAVVNELSPKREVASGKDLSVYKVKDKFFDKIKSYIDPTTKQAKELDANWRHLVIGGQKIVAFRGQALTKKQFTAFNKEAKEYWLDKASASGNQAVKTEADEVENL